MKRLAFLLAVLGGLSIFAAPTTQQVDQQKQREKAAKAQQAGNYKDAYEIFSKLALDPADDVDLAGSDLTNAVQSLDNLGRTEEVDDFREKVIALHAKNWKLLQAASLTCQNTQHNGFIIGGKFIRGGHRGNDGKPVTAFERDRMRALQLAKSAIDLAQGERQKEDKLPLAQLYFQFGNLLSMDRSGDGAWRLQYLSDLKTLPDYEEGFDYYYRTVGRGAPVDADGNPVLHKVPKAFEDSTSDGQRWRWCLEEVAELSPQLKNSARHEFAEFLHNQFGVQTMGQYRGYFARSADDDQGKEQTGIFAVHTLKDEETIARLASGIKRFALPDEFNPIKIYKQLAADDGSVLSQPCMVSLAGIYADRQQYDTAADWWKQAGRPDDVKQILGNWGVFEPTVSQPVGKEPVADFVFRNGTKLALEATEIDVPKLLADVKEFVKSNPKQLNYESIEINNVGYRLVEKDQKKYLGKQAAQWTLDLKPREKHFDKRMAIKMPLQKAGAYLVTAKLDGGNTSRIVVWVADAMIVKKPLDKGVYYYVADAMTGQPLKANLEFFGYHMDYGSRGDKITITTDNFAENTDDSGQLILQDKDRKYNNYNWLVTATTKDGKMAYMGFTGLWFGQWHDAEYNQAKAYVITDRPVYRPGQPVKFKFWIESAKYDAEGDSQYANHDFSVELKNPKGETVITKTLKTDKWGGFDGEITLDKDATLGVYNLCLPNDTVAQGGQSFRVEEYKKPEFEVKIDAPAEPVMLGEKIEAKINAKYYFGAPVTEAKVKYKVTRTSYTAQWYPAGRWDWFYEPGYWWYAYDYVWYPGWAEWGMHRPHPIWWHGRFEQPEVVLENEAPIGADGTVKVPIDTALAKAMRGDTDHKYEISAEVTDQSRRTIVGTGTVLVARKPFKVYAWVNQGFYSTGDVVKADFRAQTLDNKPVKGKGEVKLLKITYDKDAKPVETEVQKWNLDTNEEGVSQLQIKDAAAGQYRIAYTVTDDKKHAIEGGYVFVMRGEGFNGKDFRFNEVELVPDKGEYKPGDKVQLMINTNRAESTVLLFARPTNGIYLAPKLITLKGKSTVEAVDIAKKDMPNVYVEAMTISNGHVYDEAKEIVVPPESRVLNVEVKPSAEKYKPGEEAKVQIKLTEPNGEPYVGSTVVAVYDKAVEYISGGSNVPEIKEFFWKWRRHHSPSYEASLHGSANLTKQNEITMQFLGVFGSMVADLPLAPGEEQANAQAEDGDELRQYQGGAGGFGGRGGREQQFRSNAAGKDGFAPDAMPAAATPPDDAKRADKGDGPGGGGEQPQVEPTVRKNFADTALWVGSLETKKDGTAEVELTMPESLTTWKTRVWAMGGGTRCGEGSAEVVTTKNLLVRLQAPRFFTQKDEVVLSANVHNYLKNKKSVKVVLELEGNCLTLAPTVFPAGRVNAAGQQEVEPILMPAPATQTVDIDANGEKRVDWRVAVTTPGTATIRVKAVTDEESDAMQLTFPVYIHGMLKTESWSGAIRSDGKSASVNFMIPKERRPADSVLEVRYSPTLAMAMVDALPYLADYPYGCTEQTLNRFVPTVVTQKVLLGMGINLKDVQEKRTNLNAQEIGDDAARAKQWKRFDRNPVFDPAELTAMVKSGVNRLTNQQCADGGWGWFSGYGEQSYPHTTAVVVHGLQIAKANDVALVPGLLERGVDWLKRYQATQLQMLKNAPTKTAPWKEHADDLDAFIYMVLADADVQDKEMMEFIYRDRNELTVYSKATFGLALNRQKEKEKLDMILQNISQFVVQDNENQTAYLKLPEGIWFYWYGSDTEANAYYLKLLAATSPKSEVASGLAKYIINNRKHATYWNSTRDTAVCIEALGDYIRASGEDRPDLTVEVMLDGKKVKEVTINAANLFTYDNKLVLTGDAVTDGQHRIELVKKGTGPVYFNVYSTNFTLEDPITKAGLEVKVERKYYKLVAVDKKVNDVGASGQVLSKKVEKYDRVELANLASLKSGDLVEVELLIDSKNDYEYILFEDMKPAGFEPVEVRSGYNGNDLGAYMELRDERVCFFTRALARGNHSVSYRLRAEIPGKFSALPAKASAMYAPELKANSDEMKLGVTDE